MNKTPTTLIIMDGFGMSAGHTGNAVYTAKTPRLDQFFREFAQAVLNRLGYDVGEHFMDTSCPAYTEDELTFRWSDEDYQEFLDELKEFTDKD